MVKLVFVFKDLRWWKESESKKLYKSKAKRTRKKLFEIWSIVQHRALQ